MPTFELNVNGATHSIAAVADMPLLWALRDLLGLTGTKYGCGAGLCGACTVLMDGTAARSCVVPLSASAGRSITTIEGLSANGQHPVQRAWATEAVVQCGYCQGGQMLTAVALLDQTPQPTPADIDAAFAAVLCRCGTYLRIRRAVLRAAADA